MTQPKTPSLLRWKYVAEVLFEHEGEESHAWRRDHIQVISALGDMEYRGVVMPHWHVSAAAPQLKRRLTDEELDMVRREFDLEDAEEDNHSNGVARHLFRPVHLPKGTPSLCECKEDEETVVEPDGFKWQRKR